MKQLYYINACVRQESRTKKIADEWIASLTEPYEINERNLSELSLQPLNEESLRQRSRLIAQGDYSSPYFDEAKLFASADLIVIAAPYWDFSFPSSVKVWVENISISGLTFRYTEQGFPEGLCRARKMVYFTTAGGMIGDNNFGYDYLRTLFRSLYGIPEAELHMKEYLDF